MEWKSNGEGKDSKRKPSWRVSTHLTINHIPLGAELKTCDNWSGLIICTAKGMIYPSESKAKPTVKASSSLCPSVCFPHIYLPNVFPKCLFVEHYEMRDISTSLQDDIFKKFTSFLQQIVRTSRIDFYPLLITKAYEHLPSCYDDQDISEDKYRPISVTMATSGVR